MSDDVSRNIDENQVDPPTFDEFSPTSYDEWRAAAEASLKGAPFDKKLLTSTYEGITLKPLYFQQDAQDIAHQYTIPGVPPYVRSNKTRGYLKDSWRIAQEITAGSPEDYNQALQHDMARGQSAVMLILDQATRAGYDPDHVESGQVGIDGLSIASFADFKTALKGVDLKETPIYIEAATIPLPLTAFLVAMANEEGIELSDLRGCVATDPLGELVRYGILPTKLRVAYDEMAMLTHWAVDHVNALQTIAIHSYQYHNGGANAVHELAFVMATAVEYVREMQKRGLEIDVIAPRMRFMFSVGANFFMEIAKLRAAKLLWSQIVSAFGGNEISQRMKLHARTATINKSMLDPYVNMLRTTTESLSGAIGGVDSMTSGAFDEVCNVPDEFARRIARNQQVILQSEVNLTRLIDPAGGSWYVETLTDELARKSWSLFQKIEAKGGMLQALRDETPQTMIREMMVGRQTNLATRKDVIVGTNMYPNLTEKRIEPDRTDYRHLHTKRAQEIMAQRDENMKITGVLDGAGALDTLVEAAMSGATLEQMTRAHRQAQDGESQMIVPVPTYRLSESFERLRFAAENYRSKHRHFPQIFLAKMGAVAQHKARVEFTKGFFEVGGFECIDQGDGYATPEEASKAALASGAGALVICSTDDTYPEIVPALVQQIKTANPDMIVILAGYPQAHIDAFKSAGVDEFIHLKANCLTINETLQERLGVL
ncbi:MAG: methylmalonyl-CoA mutase family protein [Aggregatilineales bacterium]